MNTEDQINGNGGYIVPDEREKEARKTIIAVAIFTVSTLTFLYGFDMFFNGELSGLFIMTVSAVVDWGISYWADLMPWQI